MTDQNNGWTIVSRTKKNRTPLQLSEPNVNVPFYPQPRRYIPKKSVAKSDVVGKVVSVNLRSEFLELMDGLSLLVFSVLCRSNFSGDWPASAIKKEVNAMIKTKQFPDFVPQSKLDTLKDEYLKKDIGDVLYDGPLNKFLTSNKDVPKLWSLNKTELDVYLVV